VIERSFAPDVCREGPLRLEGDEAHHLAHVRRVRVGDVVELFDGRGTSRKGVVHSIERRAVVLNPLDEPRVADRPRRPQLTLATAVPKGDRFAWLVEKTAEIGVDRLVPLLTARSVVDPREAKLERLRRVVVEACKQSGRNTLMDLEAPISWPRFLEEWETRQGTLGFLADPEAVDGPCLPSCEVHDLVLAIGPEGGLEPAEVDQAAHLGWRRLLLGPHVLRIETAGVVGSALLLNACGRRGD
jgi:16S rRNA (uracil1498-N3)-methyltransferase